MANYNIKRAITNLTNWENTNGKIFSSESMDKLTPLLDNNNLSGEEVHSIVYDMLLTDLHRQSEIVNKPVSEENSNNPSNIKEKSYQKVLTNSNSKYPSILLSSDSENAT